MMDGADVLLCGCGDLRPLDAMYIWVDQQANVRLNCADCLISDGGDLDHAIPVDIALLAPAAKRISQ